MWTVLRARWKAILGVPALLLVTFCYVTWTVTVEGIEYAYRIPKQYELGGPGVLSWLYGASADDLEGFDTGSSTHIAIPEVEVKELGTTYSIRMLFSHDRAYESISGKDRFLNSPIRRGYDWVHGDSVRYPHFVKRVGGTLTRYYFSEEFPADEPGLQDAGRFNARIVEPSPPYQFRDTVITRTNSCKLSSVRDGILINSNFRNVERINCPPEHLVRLKLVQDSLMESWRQPKSLESGAQ